MEEQEARCTTPDHFRKAYDEYVRGVENDTDPRILHVRRFDEALQARTPGSHQRRGSSQVKGVPDASPAQGGRTATRIEYTGRFLDCSLE